MKVEQKLYRQGTWTLNPMSENLAAGYKTLVLAFGAKAILEKDQFYSEVKQMYPGGEVLLASTAGEIYDEAVYDDTVSLLAMQMEQTVFKTSRIQISDHNSSFDAGQALFNNLNAPDLACMLVISDGGVVNGSELVRGIGYANERNVPVTGGLAGDGSNFNYTLVGCNEAPRQGTIAAVGFYGNALRVGHGSIGGWDMFGIEKMVTRSRSNRLYEIGGKCALDVYKMYLGNYARELPGSALLFPLQVRMPGSNETVVRTILSIDAEDNCMVFAGDLPEGAYVRFMKANFDKLVDAAGLAAGQSLMHLEQRPKLALLISCIGRKLILGSRIEEEIEAVRNIVGPGVFLSGFYSYGEISPLAPHASCQLHNQTMTITTLGE